MSFRDKLNTPYGGSPLSPGPQSLRQPCSPKESERSHFTSYTVAEKQRALYKLAFVVTLITFAFVGTVYYLKEKSGLPPHDTVDLSDPTGFVAVVGAVIIFGSYGILIKSPTMVEANVPTLVFQIYLSTGVALCSLLVLTYTEFYFSWWGVLGAGLWVFSQPFAFLGISALGYSVALAIWAGLTIIVSFLWGSIVFGEHVASIFQAILSLSLLVLGICGVAASETSLPRRIRAWVNGDDTFEVLPVADSPPLSTYGNRDDSISITSFENDVPPVPKVVGYFCAIMVGLLNGSLLVPYHYYEDELPDGTPSIAYLSSFAIGIAIISVGLVGVYAIHLVCIQKQPFNAHFNVALVPGFMTGMCSLFFIYFCCGGCLFFVVCCFVVLLFCCCATRCWF